MEEAPEADSSLPVSGDYYYMKALDYLASSAESGSDSGSCSCLHCHGPSSDDKEEDEHFRPGLTLDDLHVSSSGSGSGNSSCRGSDVSSNRSPSPSRSSPEQRQRKCSIGGRGYKAAGGSDCSQSRVKRKLSDGHVHWADEFHKDLARCHPRKFYNRHPSHCVHQVKPILKPNSDDCAQS